MGTPVKTNQMFRARIYAQGFTLVAIVAGSIFYKDERRQRKRYEGKVVEKEQQEKKEKWLRELEMRDEEDRRWRQGVEREYEDSEARKVQGKVKKGIKDVKDQTKTIVEANLGSKSMREEVGRDRWWWRTSEAWRRM